MAGWGGKLGEESLGNIDGEKLTLMVVLVLWHCMDKTQQWINS